MGILIVDDEALVIELLEEDLNELKSEGAAIHAASSISKALELLTEHSIQVVILDKNLSERISNDPEDNGIEAIPLFIQYNDRLRILVHTSSSETMDIVRAIKLGASNYLPKDGTRGTSLLVVEQVRNALEQARMLERNMRLKYGDKSAQISKLSLDSRNPVMRALLQRLKLFAVTNEPIMLLGETGVGKTTFAEYVHKCKFNSKEAPFIQQSFNSLSGNLLEAELFGSVKGGFTDAIDKVGYLEAANGGTLFIDEIGELSLEAQAKLLTALETGVFNRVGEPTKKRKSKFRLLTATNKNPQELVRQGKMREDFFARICAFQIEIPPLSERPEDIPAIVESLLPRVSESASYQVTMDMLPRDFIDWLQANPPKLNIRGIMPILMHVVALTLPDRHGVKDFSQWKSRIADLKVELVKSKSPKIRHEVTWKDVLDSRAFLTPDFPGWKPFTRELSQKLIRENSNNLSEFSRISGMSGSTVYRASRRLTKGATHD